MLELDNCDVESFILLETFVGWVLNYGDVLNEVFVREQKLIVMEIFMTITIP